MRWPQHRFTFTMSGLTFQGTAVTFIDLCMVILSLLLLSILVHAQVETMQIAPTLGPSSPSANDQRMIFTSDLCTISGTSYPQQPLGIQALDDFNVYLIACPQVLLVYRWNVSTSTQLNFPDWTYPPLMVAQHPHTADIFVPYNSFIYSFKWNESTLPTFTPSLSTHGYNRTVCPYVCNSLGLVFSPDGSHIYVGCSPIFCDLQSPSFVVAIGLVTNQTIAINTTWAQSQNTSQLVFQNITQISFIDGTNELMIVSGQYGITVVDTSHIIETMQATRSSPSSSQSQATPTPTRVLLNNFACFNPVGTIIDRQTNLLVSLCNNQTIVWNLTSKANITVDPFGGVVVYPQTQLQACGTPFLVYHRAKRTLYQSCNSGPDRVFALQNLETPQSALFTSLVNVDTCSATSFLMIDRTQPDVLYSMCAEGMMRMEGRGLISIPTGSMCQQQSELVYDWRTDSTYVTCGSPSPPLLRFHNHHIEVLMDTSDCPNPVQLIFDQSPTNLSPPQLFLICVNAQYNDTVNATTWNISLGLADAYVLPQILFLLPSSSPPCGYSDGQFYCFTFDELLLTWNASTPDLPPEPTSLIFPLTISSLQVCADWFFFTCQSQLCVLGIPIKRIGLDEPQLFFGNTGPTNSTAFSFTNMVCDSKRKTISVAAGQDDVQLIQINVTDSANPIVAVHSFETGMWIQVNWLDIDIELNRVYILLTSSNVLTPAYLIIWIGEIQRFVSSVTIATGAAPYGAGLFVDSHSAQVFISIQASSDYTYDQVLILTSGWRCTTGTSWYQGSCLPCPIAKNRSVVLSTDESTYLIPKCGTCGAGGIADSVGTIECKQCEVGRFADINVGQVCSLCIGGFYANHTGSIACSPCESGRYSNTSESSFCYSADPGSYVGAQGQSMQFQCPSGSFSNTSEAISCQPCELGRFAATFGVKDCTTVNAGFYIDQPGQNSPQPCTPGRFNSAKGSTSCQGCSAGTFANGSNSTSCSSCQLGRFSTLAAAECSTCSVDSYTPQVGADCLSCIDQEGLECTNGLAMVAAGWWPYLINDPSFDPPLQVYRTTQCPPDYCDGAALQFASSNEKPKLCQSPRLNSPDNWLCAECEDGYIAWGSSCEPCTGPDVGLICGALILTFIIAYVLLRIDPAASPLTILFFFVQIAALEVGSVTRWIDWIQFANLGAHSFQRCLAPLTPAQQMILTLCIPFLLTTALGILCTLHRLISKYVTPSQWYQSFIFSSSSSPQPSSRFIRFIGWCSMSYDRDRYLGAINAILIFCYTPVTVTVVSALHCVEVGPPNISRLFSTPSIDCHSTEYRVILLPIVYVWLCCYVIGLPLFMLLFVWRRWQTVATILAASESSFGFGFGFGGESMQQVGSGLLHENSSSLNDSSAISSPVISVQPSTHDSLLLSNPISHSFDARWGHFYRRYRLSAWYWQPIEMIQRFAFALTSVLLIKDSHARYSLYSTISIISLSANLWSRPFASDRMNHVALVAYFLLSFVSFLLNALRPPYSLVTQLMFFALIVPFSIILFVWGIRVNVMGMQRYMKTSDGRVVLVPSFSSSISSSSIPPPRMPRSASAVVSPPSLPQPSPSDRLLPRSFSVRL